MLINNFEEFKRKYFPRSVEEERIKKLSQEERDGEWIKTEVDKLIKLLRAAIINIDS